MQNLLLIAVYLKYIEIEDKKFIDGGFTHNNPSKLVYQYILEKNSSIYFGKNSLSSYLRGSDWCSIL